MYPVWGAAGLAAVFLTTALVLFVGRFRRAGLVAVTLGVIAGVAAVGMYVTAHVRYDHCSDHLNPFDGSGSCGLTVFGDPDSSRRCPKRESAMRWIFLALAVFAVACLAWGASELHYRGCVNAAK